MSPLRQRMIDDPRIRNYSPKTIDRYVEVVAQISRHYRRSPDLLTPEDVRKYLVMLVEKRASVSQLKQVVCGVRFLFRATLGRDFPTHLIPFPREQQLLPVVLSRDEVASLVGVVTNLRHRAILATIYGTGIRVSELTHLQITDIDSQRLVVRIRQGKGQKDREVPLAPRLLELLRRYWRQYRPGPWLFPGQRANRPISKDSVERLCKRAAGAAGLTKRVTPHVLRHSWATHVLEDGTSLPLLQEALGHKSVQTTRRYTHVTPEAMASARESINQLPTFLNLPV